MEISLGSEFGKGDFFREEVNSENITFFHRIGKVTLVASIVFWRWANVPTNLAVLTKGGTGLGSHMCNYFGARRCDGYSIEIVVAKEGGVRR